MVAIYLEYVDRELCIVYSFHKKLNLTKRNTSDTDHGGWATFAITSTWRNLDYPLQNHHRQQARMLSWLVDLFRHRRYGRHL